MAQTAKRVVFRSILSKEGWEVQRDGKVQATVETQRDAENQATAAAKKHNEDGGLSQVVYHKANGEIESERTYGKDPERHPG